MVVMAVSLLDKGRWLRRSSGRTPLRRVCGDRLLLGHGRSAGARLNSDRGPDRQITAKAPRPVKTRVRPRPRHRTDHRSEENAGPTRTFSAPTLHRIVAAVWPWQMEATRCCVWQSEASFLANLWQTALRAGVDDALCLVELRGFEPLTPCMPSRDPHHSAHHRTLRSRPLHQSSKAGEWCFVWARRAELLRGCCAKWLERRLRRRAPLGTTFVSHTQIASPSALRIGSVRASPKSRILG
jgi:hypothetical protein